MTINDILDEFDKAANKGITEGGFACQCYDCEASYDPDALKSFLTTAITKALEECRPLKEGIGIQVNDTVEGSGISRCIQIYDSNVKAFLTNPK